MQVGKSGSVVHGVFAGAGRNLEDEAGGRKTRLQYLEDGMSITSGGGRNLAPSRKQIGHWGQNSVSSLFARQKKRMEQLSMHRSDPGGEASLFEVYGVIGRNMR